MWEVTTKDSTHSQILDSLYSKKTVSNFKQLIELKDSILNQLKSDGYFGLLEQPLQRLNDSTYSSEIDLGKKYTHIKINSTALDDQSKEVLDILLSRKRNKNTIPAHQLQQQLTELKDYLNNQGYNMAKVEPVEFIFNPTDTVHLTIEVTAGSLRTIDRIAIKGYPNFPKTYLKAITRKNKEANQKNINSITEKLGELSFVEVVKEPELLFKKDSTILYTYLKRTNNNTVDGMIGFNSNQDGTLELNGYLDLLLQNNLNTGELFHIIYRGDNEDQTRLNVNLKLPYILKSKIGLQSNLEILRRDSTYQNTQIKAGLFYLPNHLTEIGMNYTSTSSTATDLNNTNSRNYNFNGIGFNFIHERRNNRPLQQEQFLVSNTVNIGSRELSNDSDYQIRIKTTLLKHFRITEKQSFLAIGRLNYLKTENSIFNELYQVGGLNSIRGFNQNAIDTSFFSSINTEYRIELSPGIYIHSIVDAGYFENFNTKNLENLYSFGFGTGILTNAGLLKLSIANGVFNNSKVDFSSTIAHLNLLIRF